MQRNSSPSPILGNFWRFFYERENQFSVKLQIKKAKAWAIAVQKKLRPRPRRNLRPFPYHQLSARSRNRVDTKPMMCQAGFVKRMRRKKFAQIDLPDYRLIRRYRKRVQVFNLVGNFTAKTIGGSVGMMAHSEAMLFFAAATCGKLELRTARQCQKPL